MTTLVIVAWYHPITFSARREQCTPARFCYSTPSLPLKHLDSLLMLQAAIRLDMETLALVSLIYGGCQGKQRDVRSNSEHNPTTSHNSLQMPCLYARAIRSGDYAHPQGSSLSIEDLPDFNRISLFACRFIRSCLNQNNYHIGLFPQPTSIKIEAWRF